MLALAAAALLALVLWLAVSLRGENVSETIPTQTTEATREATEPVSQETTLPAETEMVTQPTEAPDVMLAEGLKLIQTGSYAGIYMEDGSDEPVANVMMLILQNTSEKDIQLARISLEYPDHTAEFEVTNLPAGEMLVTLERSRQSLPQEEYLSASVNGLVYFQEPMELREDVLQVTGSAGMLEVTNLSDQDIADSIYIYYKNSASDLLYGGITYRVEVRGGLPAGGTAQVISGHYNPQSSRVIMVDWGE